MIDPIINPISNGIKKLYEATYDRGDLKKASLNQKGDDLIIPDGGKRLVTLLTDNIVSIPDEDKMLTSDNPKIISTSSQTGLLDFIHTARELLSWDAPYGIKQNGATKMETPAQVVERRGDVKNAFTTFFKECGGHIVTLLDSLTKITKKLPAAEATT